MTQEERRMYLIRALLEEKSRYPEIGIPPSDKQQKMLLRSLMNLRPPRPISEGFLAVQDEYLREELRQRGTTDLADLTPIGEGIYLWQGDITTLCCDAIVNAANSQLLGCFCPCHGCIDNAIHTYAGVQLRLACAQLMKQQGCEEETGRAKITRAYNLPCQYILHTVGPIIRGRVTKQDEELLASCYHSCLELAVQNGIDSIAFCCISTGEFHFPNDRAAEIAVQAVRKFIQEKKSRIKVIFNVFKDLDYKIYRNLLGAD